MRRQKKLYEFLPPVCLDKKYGIPLSFLIFFLFCAFNHAIENQGLNFLELERLREIEPFDSEDLSPEELKESKKLEEFKNHEDFFYTFFSSEEDEFNLTKGELSYETASSRENLNGALKDRINIKIRKPNLESGISSSFIRDQGSGRFRWEQGAIGYDLKSSSFTQRSLVQQCLIGHYRIHFLENKIRESSLGSLEGSNLRGFATRFGFKPFSFSAFLGGNQKEKMRELIGFSPRLSIKNLDFGSIFIMEDSFKNRTWSASLKFNGSALSQTLFSYSFLNSPFFGNDFWRFSVHQGQKIEENKLFFNFRISRKKTDRNSLYFNIGSKFDWELSRGKKIFFGFTYDRTYFLNKTRENIKSQIIFMQKLSQKIESQLGLSTSWKDLEKRALSQTADFRLTVQPVNGLKVGGGFKWTEPDFFMPKNEAKSFFGELKAALSGNLGLVLKWKNKNLSKMNHQIYSKISYQW
ncbi:MAG: hypothetical protein HYT97_05860 [Elusimicrobia bacterium]|nr:hypothetical protein [Elusimicrobiota bacterium]